MTLVSESTLTAAFLRLVDVAIYTIYAVARLKRYLDALERGERQT